MRENELEYEVRELESRGDDFRVNEDYFELGVFVLGRLCLR